MSPEIYQIENPERVPSGDPAWEGCQEMKENQVVDTITEQWTLNHGIHRGTITSRDSAMPEKFDTREKAIAELDQCRAGYARIGYKIWYAELTAPDGTKITLESNPVWQTHIAKHLTE